MQTSRTRPPKPPDPENDPRAAADARRRIAQLADSFPLPAAEAMLPAAPTADLITNKAQLAAEAAPLTSRRRKLPSAVQPMLVAAGIFVLTLLLFQGTDYHQPARVLAGQEKPAGGRSRYHQRHHRVGRQHH